ncbi:MAG: 16S rRNA (guanine(966)-N(2))-methyltransferase RsmD [Actinobacteria bacterium RBG_16_68_21]|nr:MAG: 16S rRNA (guanine(966)-N(2))-methyltransferase RsmD [Actinobacteria bacterium RBG_16_68_21]
MRIVGGSARGRRLKAPKGAETRPMMDRVKEAIFSSLGATVEGAAVLDLYAGSGSLGLEALSRGAASAVFVEWSRAARAILSENLTHLGFDGEVVAARVEDYLQRSGPKVGLVFVDPPYSAALPSVENVLGLLARRLAAGAVVVLHRRAGSGEVAPPPGLQVADRRRYGDAEVTRLVKE